MLSSCDPYKYFLPILVHVIGTTLWNFKSPKELAMWTYGSFANPLNSLNVVYTKKDLKLSYIAIMWACMGPLL
jgi:hypothetical protein